jgi:hypothetical protein
MEQTELMDTREEQVRGNKLRIHVPRHTRVTKQSESGGESPAIGELEKPGLDNSAFQEYLAFQTKMGVTVGYLVGSLFTAGGVIGLMASFNTAAVPSNMPSGPSAWFPALACISGILAIISSYKLGRTL